MSTVNKSMPFLKFTIRRCWCLSYFKKVIIPAIHEYDRLIISFCISIFLFLGAGYGKEWFSEIMKVATFLTWHNLFEIAAILIALSIFVVSYYTYKESGNLRLIIVGNIFLAVGLLDLFHALSFKGMPDFFGVNDHANRATTFWIISRLIIGIGLLIGISIPNERKSRINRFIFTLPVLFLVILIFSIVTYTPSLIPAMYIEGQGLTLIKKILEYIVIILFLLTMYLYMREYKRQKKKLHKLPLLFAAAIMISIFSEISFVSYESVYDVYNYLGHIFKFISYFIIFQIIYAKDIIIPYREVKIAQNELKQYAKNLDVLVQQRTRELEEVNAKLLEDLDYARDLQRSLMPAEMPEEKTIGFYARYVPAERLSGDFYNVFKLDEDHIGLYIGDVAGHGVSAAMLTLFVNQNIKPLKELDEGTEIVSPAIILEDLYKVFNKANFKDETYFVMLYGIYHIKTGVFVYASGGINVEPIIIKSSGALQLLDVKGFAICRLGNLLAPVFLDRSIQFAAGDKILFYTDGLVDVEDKQGEKFSNQELERLLEKFHFLTGRNLAEKIMDHLFQYAEFTNKIKDDITFILIEIR